MRSHEEKYDRLNINSLIEDVPIRRVTFDKVGNGIQQRMYRKPIADTGDYPQLKLRQDHAYLLGEGCSTQSLEQTHFSLSALGSD